MARIFLDARNLSGFPNGVGRYGAGLIPELLRQAPEHEFVVVARNGPGLALASAPNARAARVSLRDDGLKNHLFGWRELAAVGRGFGEPDLYHSLFHVLPRRLPRRWKVVVTLHDLIWMQAPGVGRIGLRSFARVALPYSLARADHTVVVSEATRERAARWLAGEAATVIGHGVAPRFFDPAPRPARFLEALEGAPYVAAIASPKPHKNLGLLARAMRLVPQGWLVLIGNTAALEATLRASGIAERTLRVGVLGDGALQGVAAGASLFVVPSLIEGFGLPALEAMALGAPVAVSDVEPLRTVCGDAAARFDPIDPSSLAAVIRRALADPRFRSELAARGRARARELTWARAARETLEVYDRILGTRAPGARGRSRDRRHGRGPGGGPRRAPASARSGP